MPKTLYNSRDDAPRPVVASQGLVIGGSTTPTVGARQMTMYLRDNSTLRFLARGADGVVRFADLELAPLFDRAPIMSLSPLVYLDADTKSQGTWTDLSGHGYDFTIDDAAVSSIGAVPCLDFTGGYRAARAFVPPVPLSSSVTVVVFSTLTERQLPQATTLIGRGDWICWSVSA